MKMRVASLAAILALGIGYMLVAPAQAQESAVKQCGDKWAAAKTAGTTGGLTWPKFLSQCRAEMAGNVPAAAPATVAPPVVVAPAPIPTATAAPVTRTTPAALPAPTQQAAVPAAKGPVIFPSALSPQFASESPGKARMETCLAQYKANKTNNGNGGLNWIMKGGGYYSECNKRLKG